MVVRGVVQGVGFRPFVFGLARRLDLAGDVRNTSGAVLIEVEGPAERLAAFVAALRTEAPRLARITALERSEVPVRGVAGFSIETSQPVAGEYQPIAPDAATCADCLGELLDSGDRRHRYPFINCTACGPRFTIIEDVPYDRALTTMRRFTMCAPCRREYEDPGDRRFHAQPNACPRCGPRAWLADGAGEALQGEAVALAAALLAEGGIVAVKGLGGFQLACDAGDEAAVECLRQRKRRPAKPFAVMVRDLAAAAALGHVDALEALLLESPARPVVLLRRRDPGGLAPGVAPGLDEVGVMLPSTPLHHLLLADAGRALVMTSGNLSEEPIAKSNDEAVERLHGVADAFLLHDRDIYARYDDSVVRAVAGEERVLRRARGYCPVPTELGGDSGRQVLALGAHLKNSFCVLRDGHAFVGPHIGDLDHPLTLEHQAEALRTYLRLFRAAPAVVACDLHPDYASTRLAGRWWEAGAAAVQVQHHHAHIASVMAEHGLRGPVLGVAFDGIGLGPDGTIWGGELLRCDERGFERLGHLTPVRQPGGDLCAREGWRMAIAYLEAARLPHAATPPEMLAQPGIPDERRWRLVARVAASPSAAPLSSSAGRLFDAVASLLGVAHTSSFEAEAAMRLEALAGKAGGRPEAIEVPMTGSPLVLDSPALVRSLLAQSRAGRPAAELAAVFHESLAVAIVRACELLAGRTGVTRVALSGGVFQNALLLRRTLELLGRCGLPAYANRSVPANDGGISLGQALVASARDGSEEIPPQ